MKKIILQLVIMMMAIAMQSCRELAQDGDLSGQWQITSIDYADGTSTDPQGKYYYCFYRDVAQLTSIYTTRITANMIYDRDAATITLHFPYDEVATLSSWGITSPDAPTPDATVMLTINHLTSSRLIMTTPTGATISCRKY